MNIAVTLVVTEPADQLTHNNHRSLCYAHDSQRLCLSLFFCVEGTVPLINASFEPPLKWPTEAVKLVHLREGVRGNVSVNR
jgi:hypothetical protein